MATNFTEEELEAVPRQWRHLYNRVWDVTDFVVMMIDGSSDDDDDDGYDEVPAMENSAVFVMTNVVITPNQSRAECAESAGLWNCARDADCPPGRVNNLGGRRADDSFGDITNMPLPQVTAC